VYNWVLHAPDPGIVLEFTQGSNVVTLDSPIAEPDWTNASLWTFGANAPELRRSWRIVDVLADDQIRLHMAAPVSALVEADDFGGPHRDPWVVMRNRAHSPNHRPEYITVADEATGLHTDGSPGFRFGS